MDKQKRREQEGGEAISKLLDKADIYIKYEVTKLDFLEAVAIALMLKFDLKDLGPIKKFMAKLEKAEEEIKALGEQDADRAQKSKGSKEA